MCGIFGAVTQKSNVSLDIYEALTMLQHRGQDSAGMVAFDGRFFHARKSTGLVREVFRPRDIAKLKGKSGIGHVRYPTAGSLDVTAAQPFFVNSPFGMYLIHNGNLTNTKELRRKVTGKYHRHLLSDSDSELLLNVLANALHKILRESENGDPIKQLFDAVCMTMERIKGAYSVIVVIDKLGVLAFRDPYGIRPLAYGKRGAKEHAFASEDVAFAPIGFKKVRDVAPGEAILVGFNGRVHTRQCVEGERHPCIFEYIYLARPDSMIDGISVYKTQMALGKALAVQIKDSQIEFDSVIPVPDSSRPAALEIAKALHVNYREGLVKNRYVGRTFIMADQEKRERSVRQKLNAIPLEFKNRSVLLVDDSIVRGTTMKQIIAMCRDVGARKVYVASAAPAVRHPNVYGVDLPTRTELVAHEKTTKQVANAIGADRLFYQTVEDMQQAARYEAAGIEYFEDSCFSGNYITGDIDEKYLEALERKRRKGRK